MVAPTVLGHFINGPLDGQSHMVPDHPVVFSAMEPEPDADGEIWRRLDFERPYPLSRAYRVAAYEQRVISDGDRYIHLYVFESYQ